jgi:hypothetical protein
MMKKLIVLFGITLVAAFSLHAQTNAPAAVQLSHKIAKKMKDTLDLSAQQRQQIYQVNMQLHNEKQAVRQQNPPPDSLTVRIQRVERRRDSLYLPILGNEKYQLYLQKKRNLVSNN